MPTRQQGMLQTFLSDQNPYFRLLKWATLLLLPFALVFHFDSINQSTFLWLNNPANTVGSDALWVVLTNFGDGFFLFPLTMLLFVMKPRQQLAVILTMLTGAVLIHCGKSMVDSLRPAGELGTEMLNIIGPTVRKQSLPSGHTGTVFLLVGLVLAHYKGAARWWVLLFGALVAFSRIVVGAHWPQDLVWGIWVGILAAVIGSTLADRIGSGLKSRLFMLFLTGVCAVFLPFYDNGFQEYFPFLIYWQYALAGLSLVLALVTLFTLYKDYVEADLFVEGTLVNKLYKLVQRLVKFGLVGATGFVVDMGVYWLLSVALGIPHLVARGGSYWVAASWNWFWNRTFTFSHVEKRKKAPQWIKYLSMCMVSFLPNWGSYYLLTKFVPFFADFKMLAMVAGVLAGMMFNFTFASVFIFATGRDASVREG
ncbi:GtrA family protein [Endozoicomonas euniceicola]|uniref:GtrA family protein n=1 Tax=Endozoicomonas euniceicola TaxID=1234143 RepID=A0ABY6GUM6_9GAMM|nr:GtrA family protein [Endozoicomonas euniceicola]UYM16089.1 GtrA family protein [Endozoicomonas euniceicola]